MPHPVVPTSDVAAPTDDGVSHQITDEPAFSFSTTVDVPTFLDASGAHPAVDDPSPVVPEVSADVNIDNDNAKQILVDKIMAAVNEYIASMPKSVDTKDKDEKIASLEQELTEKNKKLDEILSLLGKN